MQRQSEQTVVLARVLVALLSLAFCVALPLNFLNSASAEDALGGRFLDFSDENNSITYDLATVELIQPGKFTIVVTTINHPDVMRLKLKAIDVLRRYCSRPDGKYPAPAELFTLGQPDLPVDKIEVKTRTIKGEKPFKNVVWNFPYKRLASSSKEGVLEKYPSFFDCSGRAVQSEDQSYREERSAIMNGFQRKEMYDCKRAIMGVFVNLDDPLSRVISGEIRGGFLGHYLPLCGRVTGELPYIP